MIYDSPASVQMQRERRAETETKFFNKRGSPKRLSTRRTLSALLSGTLSTVPCGKANEASLQREREGSLNIDGDAVAKLRSANRTEAGIAVFGAIHKREGSKGTINHSGA